MSDRIEEQKLALKKILGAAKTEQELNKAALLCILDLSYPRDLIAAAVSDREKELRRAQENQP